MKRWMVVVGLGLLAVSANAFADENAQAPVVHVDANSDTVLERVDGSHRTAVCRAPCDVSVDSSKLYQIDGEDMRVSNTFRIPNEERRFNVRVDRGGTGSFTAGIVLTVLGGAFLAGSVAFLGASLAAKDFSGLFLGPASIGCAAVSLATGIPGIVMLANNASSRARVFEGDRLRARAPRRPFRAAWGSRFLSCPEASSERHASLRVAAGGRFRAGGRGWPVRARRKRSRHTRGRRARGRRAHDRGVALCDRFIAPGTYRLSSDAFRSSNTFHVSAVARNVDVQIRETGRSKLTSAIVLLTVSGLFAAGGLPRSATSRRAERSTWGWRSASPFRSSPRRSRLASPARCCSAAPSSRRPRSSRAIGPRNPCLRDVPRSSRRCCRARFEPEGAGALISSRRCVFT